MKLGGKSGYDLLVVDGSHLSYKCYAVQTLQTKDGVGTGAIFGTLRSLAALVGKYKPKHCILLYDMGRNKARMAKMGDYKEETEKDPVKLRLKQESKAEFRRQVGELMDLLPLLNIYSVGFKDMEADDAASIISYISPMKVLLASGDKDWLQLVDDNTHIVPKYADGPVVTNTNWLEYAKQSLKHEGLEISRDSWKLFRAIVGDPSDKIKGVPGMGVKTTAPLVNGYTNIQDLLKGIGDKHKKYELLKRCEKDVETFQWVMDLETSRDDESLITSCVNAIEARVPVEDHEVFKERCIELEFHSIVKGIHVFMSKFRSLKI